MSRFRLFAWCVKARDLTWNEEQLLDRRLACVPMQPTTVDVVVECAIDLPPSGGPAWKGLRLRDVLPGTIVYVESEDEGDAPGTVAWWRTEVL